MGQIYQFFRSCDQKSDTHSVPRARFFARLSEGLTPRVRSGYSICGQSASRSAGRARKRCMRGKWRRCSGGEARARRKPQQRRAGKCDSGHGGQNGCFHHGFSPSVMQAKRCALCSGAPAPSSMPWNVQSECQKTMNIATLRIKSGNKEREAASLRS